MKRISEIFSDYEAEGNINSAVVQAVVLTKSTKTLEMKISSDKYIETREIESLNRFIRERLALNDSIITVEYSEGTHRKPLEEALNNILSSLAEKHPVLKGALKNCDYEIAQNQIKFTFKSAVSYLLKARGYDKKIQEAIKNLYDAAYQINFVDNVSSEELKRLQEDTQEKEILLLQREGAVTPCHNTFESAKEAAPIKSEIKGENEGKKGDP
ncbi:PolC-type DNA polymerase III N-terminal domain-containing protein, partial [Desulfosporosinus sp.]|uniref:PolC-type DNA polymerase III N-terminal domain-containing protein n=1 Tax=Desulfosporosinus sp. TaxID=157907 RepID=UPI0025C632DB